MLIFLLLLSGCSGPSASIVWDDCRDSRVVILIYMIVFCSLMLVMILKNSAPLLIRIINV